MALRISDPPEVGNAESNAIDFIRVGGQYPFGSTDTLLVFQGIQFYGRVKLPGLRLMRRLEVSAPYVTVSSSMICKSTTTLLLIIQRVAGYNMPEVLNAA